MKDDLEKQIDPELYPFYEKMKEKLLLRAKTESWDKYGMINEHMNVIQDGKKLTLRLTFCKWTDGKIKEQFEYYHYRYSHMKDISL